MRIIIKLLLITIFIAFINRGDGAVNEDYNLNENINDINNIEILEPYIKISPPSIQVYYYTKIYCKLYGVPETIAFGVAKLETNYRGPDNHHYNPLQISYANAMGTYQLLLSTAKDMYVLLNLGPRNELTSEMLLNDVELNTKLGIRYLRWIHDNISKDWKIVCGFYNTGYPTINEYAISATKYFNTKNN